MAGDVLRSVRRVWCSSGLGSFGEDEDGCTVDRFPRTCWLEEVQRLDGDDLNLAALRRFRVSEKQKKEGKERARRRRPEAAPVLRSGEEREGGALRRFPSMSCSDEVYSGGAMLEKTRPCTDSDGVQRDGEGEKEKDTAAAARGRNGEG